MKISAAIITFNEEKNISEAIESVAWADEIVVVDSESSDRTAEIARQLGAKVHINPWPGFSKQKQFAADLCKNDFVLSIDADERVSDQLRQEIVSLTETPQITAYSIPRLAFYCGKPVRHCGWYPDRQIRLFNRKYARWNNRIIHESIEVSSGNVAKLQGHILHYTISSTEEHARLIAERYAPLAAKQMLKENVNTSFAKAHLAATLTFIKTYFLKLGMLDGKTGLQISYFAAHNTLLKHLILKDLRQACQLTKRKTEDP
ncbi:MAG TPA: glycosyltransferase family 2 protein, partial [Pyrinomonadaceae bacterium]|nr:glycosyltransferase family 2 protein [Pyrinomonadaceae bacterium]